MRILFAGGGSIGHIAPALAVWEALRERRPEACAHFVCAANGTDGDFLAENGCAFTAITTPRIGLRLPLQIFTAYRQAARTIDAFNPDIVFSKGGAISVPVCFAAHRKNIPIVLHESDAVSGRANRLVARWAQRVCTECGNPVRRAVTHGSREKGLALTGFSGNRPILLVMGGSQGAQTLNGIVLDKLNELTTICDIIHITGKGKSPGPSISQNPSYWSAPFVIAELPHLYAIASAALSRAGAGAIAELEANGIPAVLVPLRGVGHDHQYTNAVVASRKPLFMHLEQETLREQLFPAVRQLIARDRNACPPTGTGPGSSAGHIAGIVLQTLASSWSGQ